MNQSEQDFEELQRQRDAFLQRLGAAEVVEVTGLVDASGAGGYSAPGDDQTTLMFKLATWRIGTGPLSAVPLDLRRRLPRKEFDRLWAEIKADSIIRITAQVLTDEPGQEPEGIFHEYQGTVDSDRELNAALERALEPTTYETSQFGVLEFDRRYEWYEGQVRWLDSTITLTLSAESADELPPLLSTAEALWADQANWNRRIQDYAVAQLLPLKNEAWLEEGESPVTPEEFRQRMELQSIGIEPDGQFTFWHNDGDLFWGHSIQICGNVTDGPDSADIPG